MKKKVVSDQRTVISDQLSVVSKKPEDYFFRASAADFNKIPGSPIAYWVSEGIRNVYSEGKLIGDRAKKGLTTGNNDQFVRYWWEVITRNFSVFTGVKWFPTQKGGQFRKWYGNFENIINWENNGSKIKNFKFPNGKLRSVIRNEIFYFKSGISWTDVSSGKLSVRYVPDDFLFNASGPTIFSENDLLFLGNLNSVVAQSISEFICPTLHYEVGQLQKFPFVVVDDINLIKQLVQFSKNDWNSYETSWEFNTLPLLGPDCYEKKLENTFQTLCTHWQQATLEMQLLEEENNCTFIEAYGLQDELTPEVPLNEITLTCNPHYRYKGNKSEEELEALLLADTMKEFLSYAVGCMFGRYSLDAPGLILANQGETLDDYFRIVKEKEVVSCQLSVISKGDGSEAATDNCKLHTDNSAAGGTDNSENIEISFSPDADNVIPILGDNWFTDDITDRFQCFLRTTFGTEHYEENLKFITDAIGKDIRKYFLKDFYKDHLKTYKKRPIYWLFSSPKGSFNALIYMHRYRPDTVSVILNDYLREFRTKLQNAQENLEQLSISADATKTEKIKALKQIEKLKKTITELDTYENETLYPLATQNIEIDLDDGVKVNYKKFGKALKKVPGLS